jgi:hypothetical protein
MDTESFKRSHDANPSDTFAFSCDRFPNKNGASFVSVLRPNPTKPIFVTAVGEQGVPKANKFKPCRVGIDSTRAN